jgi:hypothetical protein
MARHRLPSDVKPSLYAACATVISRSDNKYETAIILNQRRYVYGDSKPRLRNLAFNAPLPQVARPSLSMQVVIVRGKFENPASKCTKRGRQGSPRHLAQVSQRPVHPGHAVHVLVHNAAKTAR